MGTWSTDALYISSVIIQNAVSSFIFNLSSFKTHEREGFSLFKVKYLCIIGHKLIKLSSEALSLVSGSQNVGAQVNPRASKAAIVQILKLPLVLDMHAHISELLHEVPTQFHLYTFCASNAS